jgi:hypothetical protein
VQHLARTLPDRFVAKSGAKNRVGRIFIDYLRNGFGATTVRLVGARAAGAGHLGAGALGRTAGTPHLKVTVDWTIGHYTEPWEKRKHMTVAEESDCCWTQRTLSKTVPVERYGEKGGRLQVFFLPDDEVQVWVYDAGPQNPEHPSGRGYPRNTNPEK